MKHSSDPRAIAFIRLLDIMDDLREKCPWDRKQTFQTLRNLTIEETYELTDALLEEDLPSIKEELGDLLLHIVFYSKIGAEKKAFTIEDVLNSICEKLIHRHPHIYGDTVVNDDNDVKQNWEQLKLKEGKKSILEGVPNSLPALIKAQRLQEKTAQVGFEWENTNQVIEKVEEELLEFKDEINKSDPSQEKIEEEFGDFMFSLVNVARFLKIEPESALEKVNKKFKFRFEFIEKNAEKPLVEMSLQEMDRLWKKAKEC
ncbi:nucleoside triphosphate pyrophosphohydrolase [Membranihabitans maritimus]|uniref:nucleoside triphosphate pyrophosphohydrolase n=1 Tax=Membranihabitans maritimus TaxID=2904244 RepID=UPI001F22FA53|nr:nucleoside triphosphate pyrophosphohydrolase [Membranihabitans maritimus]